MTDVNVVLTAITHTRPDDIDVLLVGPEGQTVILMSDVGGSNELAGVTLTFDQSAGQSLPDSDEIVSGSYLPTNVGENDSFPSPAPSGTRHLTLEVFNDTNTNGTWRLFVVDDAGGQTGVIGAGYSVVVTSRE